jgi:hypothetical protein
MKTMKTQLGGILTILALGLYAQEAKITVHATDENGIEPHAPTIAREMP